MRRPFTRLRRYASLVLFAWLAATFVPTAAALAAADDPVFLGELCSINLGGKRQANGDESTPSAERGHCVLCGLQAVAAAAPSMSTAFLALRSRVEPPPEDDPPRPGVRPRATGGARAPPAIG